MKKVERIVKRQDGYAWIIGRWGHRMKPGGYP
jgi:hypothetical protein